MNDLYPDEALDFPTMDLADIIRIELDETLGQNDGGPTQAVFALALALAWRLQSFPMNERRLLHARAAELVRVNALGLGDEAYEN